jgi:putative thioredoxin
MALPNFRSSPCAQHARNSTVRITPACKGFTAVERDVRDLDARWALASAHAARGNFAQALEEFLDLVSRNRKFRDDGARLAMLAIFEHLGESDLTHEYRRRLQMVT